MRDDKEIVFLLSYKENTGSDKNLLSVLKRGISTIIHPVCPKCKENSLEIKSRIKTNVYKEVQCRTVQYNGKDVEEKRTITTNKYKLVILCNTCRHEWSKYKSEVNNGIWKKKII